MNQAMDKKVVGVDEHSPEFIAGVYRRVELAKDPINRIPLVQAVENIDKRFTEYLVDDEELEVIVVRAFHALKDPDQARQDILARLNKK